MHAPNVSVAKTYLQKRGESFAVTLWQKLEILKSRFVGWSAAVLYAGWTAVGSRWRCISTMHIVIHSASCKLAIWAGYLRALLGITMSSEPVA